MDAAVARKLIDELPTPLAQLTARALNARAGRDRHDAVFYLGEATLKLAASVRIGRWIETGLEPGSDLAKRLESVVFPSLGHWCSFFRDTGTALANREDPCFSRAAKELEKTPPASTGLTMFADALGQWEVVDRDTAKRVRKRGVIGFWDAFVAYRNAVVGHGAQRSPKFYDEASSVMFAALAEVFRSPHLFGGLRLAMPDLDVASDGTATRTHWRELQGMFPVPLQDSAENAKPGQLYFRGAEGVVPIHPFVIFAPADGERARFGFLNRAVERKEQIARADYLDYLTSEVIDGVDAAPALSAVLTRLRGAPASVRVVQAVADAIPPSNPALPTGDWVGRVIGAKYRITKKIGEGGMGAVYAAEHVELPRRYAVKTILPELSKNEELVERFRREAFAAAKLRHRGIVDVLDFGRADDGSVYMVMEFLEGKSVDDLVEATGPLPLDQIVTIAKESLEALAVAHDAGLVHRDLKPANLFLMKDGTLKLLDFGIAKITTPEGGANLTQSGAMLGTPLFMSPEQIMSSRDVSARADVYSMGAMLYLLLTGQYSVDGPTMAAVIARVSEGQIDRDPRRLRPETPDWLARVVMRALAKDPAARYASAAEMRAALDPNAPADEPLPPAVPAPPASTPTMVSATASPKTAPKRWGLIGAGVAVVIAIAGVAAARPWASGTRAPPAALVAESPPLSLADLQRQYGASVVYLDTVDGKGTHASGTGWLVDSDGTIVTASYVVDRDTKVHVVFENGGEVDDTQVVEVDDARSYTILRANIGHPKSGTVPAFTPLAISRKDDVPLGERLVSFGYASGTKTLVAREGTKSSARPVAKYDWFGATLPVVLGEGGGPVMNMRGEVVGMIAASTKTEALVVPASTLRSAVARR